MRCIGYLRVYISEFCPIAHSSVRCAPRPGVRGEGSGMALPWSLKMLLQGSCLHGPCWTWQQWSWGIHPSQGKPNEPTAAWSYLDILLFVRSYMITSGCFKHANVVFTGDLKQWDEVAAPRVFFSTVPSSKTYSGGILMGDPNNPSRQQQPSTHALSGRWQEPDWGDERMLLFRFRMHKAEYQQQHQIEGVAMYGQQPSSQSCSCSAASEVPWVLKNVDEHKNKLKPISPTARTALSAYYPGVESCALL